MQTLGELLHSPVFLGLVAAAMVVGFFLLGGLIALREPLKRWRKSTDRLAGAISTLNNVLAQDVSRQEVQDITERMNRDLRHEVHTLAGAMGLVAVTFGEWVTNQIPQPIPSEPRPARQYGPQDTTRLLGTAALDLRTGFVKEDGKRYIDLPFYAEDYSPEAIARSPQASRELWNLLMRLMREHGGSNARLWEPHPNGAGSWYTVLCSTVMREEYGYMPDFVIQNQFLWLADDPDYQAWKAKQRR